MQDDFWSVLDKIREQLEAIKNSLQEQRDDIRNQSEATHQTWEKIPASLAELRIPADERTKADSYRKKAHRQQVWLTWGTWLAFIAAAVYAGFAYRTMREAQKQTTAAQHTAKAAQDQATLMRQQLEGTQAARVGFTQPPTFSTNPEFGTISIYLSNTGNVNAPTVKLKWTITGHSLDKNGKIGEKGAELYNREFTMTELTPSKPTLDPFRQSDVLYPSGVYDLLMSQRYAIKLDYALTYDDGFSHRDLTVSGSYCYLYDEMGSFSLCEDIPFRYKRWMDYRQQHPKN